MRHDLYLMLLSSWSTMRYWLIGLSLFVVPELIFPAERAQPWRDKLSSLAFSVFYCVTIPFVVWLPTHYFSEPLLNLLRHPLWSLDLDALAGGGRRGWVLRNLLFPFGPILVLDFFYYWTHRLQHTIPALWRQHKLHHMEYSLCVASNFRHHWLEEAVRIFTLWFPMTLLIQVTGGAGSVLTAVLAYWSFFIHANLKLPLGVLGWFVAGPQTHRIHHSALPEHFNKNYAAYFPLWDILFGSYHHPRKGEWPPTGMTDGERVRGFLHGLVLPFSGLPKLSARATS